MKKLTIVALALAIALCPLPIQADDGPGARCNGHMCPLARAATTDGYNVVTSLPLTYVVEGEFLS